MAITAGRSYEKRIMEESSVYGGTVFLTAFRLPSSAEKITDTKRYQVFLTWERI
jgi:hypothetical protein